LGATSFLGSTFDGFTGDRTCIITTDADVNFGAHFKFKD